MLKRVAYLLLLLPVLVFGQVLDKVAAVVNEDVITESELNQEVKNIREQYLAKNIPIPEPAKLREKVLQHLIDVNLELQLAKKNHLKIEDAELNAALERIATSNKFSLEQLKQAVEGQGLPWQKYRENIRKEMLISRVQQKAVDKEINVSDKQIETYLKTAPSEDKSKAIYHLQAILIPLPEDATKEQEKRAMEKARVLTEKIKQKDELGSLVKEASTQEFILETYDLGPRPLAELPELFGKEVVKMKPGQVSLPLRAGNGVQLVKLVSLSGLETNHVVLKSHVRHILLKQDVSMGADEVKKEADNLYQQLKAGKDFALMAKQYSKDRASAIKGGDLGWVGPGELVPEFEKAMNTLALNRVSKPIKSPFGLHIIEVLERKTVDDSKNYKYQQAKFTLQQKQFGEAVNTWLQHMRTSAYIKVMDKGTS